jgi:PAS domain S-box-containing protein
MPRATRTLAIVLAVGTAYFLAALAGFRAAFVAEQISIVWAPTGIAQAALLLWGFSLVPAIWLAAFAANATTGIPLWAAGGIATGNTLEAVAAAWLLSRVPGFNAAFKRVYDAGAFVLFAVVTSPLISASIGVAVLCAAALEPWTRYGELWREWWLGDALGALVVGPAILATFKAWRDTRGRAFETVALVLLAFMATAALSGSYFTSAAGSPLLAFFVFPLVIVAAVRLGQPATAIVTLGAAAAIVWRTMAGAGYHPVGPDELHQNLIVLDMFLGVLAGSGLLLAAATTERRILERRRAAAYAAGSAIASAASLQMGAPKMLGAICSNLGWQYGALWLVDADRRTLRCTATWAEDEDKAAPFVIASKAFVFTAGVGLPGRVWASGAPSWIEDAVVDQNFPRAAAADAAGLHGAFCFPIRRNDEFLGVAEFFSASVAVIDHDLLTTMAGIGRQIGDFVTRKQIEREIITQQTRTRAILDTALDAIITMDQHGRITEFNTAAERMFGYSRTQAIGEELAALIIPAALQAHHRKGLSVYLDTGSGPFIDRRVETTAVSADGREFPVEVSITRVPIVPPVFTGFVRDTTERVHAERQRRGLLDAEAAARREAEQANRAKDEFLATLSHELRTPLNAIVGWTRMLLDGILDEQSARRALAIIDRNAHAQAQLVTDLLDISRIITGKLTLTLRPVDIGSVVGAALDTVRPAAAHKHIMLTPGLASPARVITGDFYRLQQAVSNLLSNAIKFTPEGGTVDVQLSEHGGRMRLSITDSGVGIDSSFLPHVFERFRQADGSTTREHGGLGLGLAIVRHIVELHGGTVSAESGGPGKGATFTVELPAAPDAADGSRVSGDDARGTRMSDERPLDRCRALVVDDDEDARHLLDAILSRAGAVVRVAASVDEAMALFKSERFDVVLADLGLPGKDGYALVREIRASDSDVRRTQIIAVTAYARPEDREKVLAYGFDDHLAKPADPRRVIELIGRLCARRVNSG